MYSCNLLTHPAVTYVAAVSDLDLSAKLFTRTDCELAVRVSAVMTDKRFFSDFWKRLFTIDKRSCCHEHDSIVLRVRHRDTYFKLGK